MDSYGEHDTILKRVLYRSKELDAMFNKSKLQYRIPKVKYLINIFSIEVIKPYDDRAKAIVALEHPKNKKELKCILGMINYCRTYIPNLSELNMPLCELFSFHSTPH